MKERRYGAWAGNPAGVACDPARCVEGVFKNHRERQCTRPRGHGPDGRYCRQHAAALERREATRKALSARAAPSPASRP